MYFVKCMHKNRIERMRSSVMFLVGKPNRFDENFTSNSVPFFFCQLSFVVCAASSTRRLFVSFFFWGDKKLSRWTFQHCIDWNFIHFFRFIAGHPLCYPCLLFARTILERFHSRVAFNISVQFFFDSKLTPRESDVMERIFCCCTTSVRWAKQRKMISVRDAVHVLGGSQLLEKCAA